MRIKRPRSRLFSIAWEFKFAFASAPTQHAPRNFAERAALTSVNLDLLLAEASDGSRFGIVYVEDGKQLRYLKHFLKL